MEGTFREVIEGIVIEGGIPEGKWKVLAGRKEGNEIRSKEV